LKNRSVLTGRKIPIKFPAVVEYKVQNGPPLDLILSCFNPFCTSLCLFKRKFPCPWL